MKFSNLLNNSFASIAFAIGIYFPVVQVFDNMILAIGAGAIAGIVFFIYLNNPQKEADENESSSVRANSSRYTQRFAIAMGGYITLLFASRYLLKVVDIQALQILIALLPVIPVSYGLWAYMQWVGDLDEFQKRIQFEAIAFSLGMTGVITFTIGFLEDAGIPQPGLIWIFPMIIAFWGLGQFIASRRYQ